MPDVSLCRDHECPSKVHCYRYRAKPSKCMQSYIEPKRKPNKVKCDMYESTAGWDDRCFLPMTTLKQIEEMGK